MRKSSLRESSNYDANSSYATSANSNGWPARKDCSKSSNLSESSAAQGGSRIRLRPQWPGTSQRRPRTQAPSIHFSRRVIAWRRKDTNEKPNREPFWIAVKSLPRSSISAYPLSPLSDFRKSKNMDFHSAIHGTNDNRKSNATQNPKLTYPLIGNNASKHVYQTNSRRKRTEKSGTATLLVSGPPEICREPDGRADKTNFWRKGACACTLPFSTFSDCRLPKSWLFQLWYLLNLDFFSL